MVAAESWDENSAFLEFETRDMATLQVALDDEPVVQVVLFQDGAECRGMREVQIEALGESVPLRVRVTHRNELPN
jgi:hypothetical protein